MNRNIIILTEFAECLRLILVDRDVILCEDWRIEQYNNEVLLKHKNYDREGCPSKTFIFNLYVDNSISMNFSAVHGSMRDERCVFLAHPELQDGDYMLMYANLLEPWIKAWNIEEQKRAKIIELEKEFEDKKRQIFNEQPA